MKNILLLPAIFFITFGAFGQKKFEIGLNGGINSSTQLSKDKPSGMDIVSKTGSNLGLSFQYRISKYISFRSGVELAGKKVLYNRSYEPVYNYSNQTEIRRNSTKQTFTNQYLTIPVCVRFSIGNKISLFGDMGGYYSFLTSSTSKISYGTSNVQKDAGSDNFQKSDFGCMVGIGVAYQLPFLNNISVSLEGIDYYGLKDVSCSGKPDNHSYSGSYDNINYSDKPYKVRNNSFAVLLGVAYAF